MLKIFYLLIPFTLIFAVDYNSEIQPIFDNNCGNCHLGNSSGGLNLSSYNDLMDGSNDGAVIVPGNAESSVLYQEILSGDMPGGNNPNLSSAQISLIAQWINEGALESELECDEGFTQIPSVPTTCIVFDQSDCFHDGDLATISEIAESNGIFNLDPLYLGSQNWLGGRLKRIQVGNYFQGGNIELTSLPESISTLDSLTTLQVDKNDLTSLPESIGNLSRLQLLIASNNNLENVPSSIGDLSQVWYLDLGYNNLETLPSTISGMNALQYLYIFGNQLSSLPDSICDLGLDWSGLDDGFMPYFACGGNLLCENVPDCVENSSNFEIALEANYYSFTIELLQDCGQCFTEDIWINEVHADDDGVGNPYGEDYIEIYNSGDECLLTGFKLDDSGQLNDLVFGDISIAQDEYLVLVREEEGSFNSDLDASSGGQIFFCNPSGLCTFFIFGATEGTTAYGYPFDDNTETAGNLSESSPGEPNSELAPDCTAGDVNSDGAIDVLDIVGAVNIVLGNTVPSDTESCAADFNGDGGIDVLDIVGMVNVILN